MTFWVIGIAIIAICTVVCLRRSKSRSRSAGALVKEAASLGWQKKSEMLIHGFPTAWAKPNVRFVRDDHEAVVWLHDASVTLVRMPALTFENFVELERWLETHEAGDDDDGEGSDEVLYYRDIERFVARHGYSGDMVEAEGTDELFCKAAMNFRKAAYLAHEESAIAGAIILDALLKHKVDRQGSILFMAGIIKQFADRERAGSK